MPIIPALWRVRTESLWSARAYIANHCLKKKKSQGGSEEGKGERERKKGGGGGREEGRKGSKLKF
jgi:hypothetical protein